MASPYSPTVAATIPSSPTLTNPDLILPDGDYSRSSTPSPSPPPAKTVVRSSAIPKSFQGLGAQHAYAAVASLPADSGTALPRVLSPAQAFRISGSHESHSRMTVRRSEENMGSRSTSEGHRYSSSVPSLAAGHNRGMSITVSESEDETLSVADHDDPREDENERKQETQAGKRVSMSFDQLEGLMEHDGEDEFSSQSLSIHAERILANAKRRLDHMEGNLSRARHSLIVSPSRSLSPYASGSPTLTAHLPFAYKLGSKAPFQKRSSALEEHHGLQNIHSSAKSTSTHTRVLSETSVPSSTTHGLGSQGTDLHGSTATEVAPSNHAWTETKADQIGYRNYLASSSHTRLTPLPSSAALNLVDEDGDSLVHGLGMDGLPTTSSYSSSSRSRPSSDELPDSKGQSRSRSAVPIRQVRTQMEDLKGRISNLQQRSRVESLRRRSLQGMRTPSPFTAAEQWYLGGDEYHGDGLSASARVGRVERPSLSSQRRGEGRVEGELGTRDESLAQSLEEDTMVTGSEDTGHNPQDVPLPETPGEDEVPEGGAEVRDDSIAESVATEESDDRDYHDSTDNLEDDLDDPSIIGERHEDRADAFDYEHFFLHSGMGNYAKGDDSRRNSYASNDSGGSADTARPTPVPQDDFSGDDLNGGPTGLPQRASMLAYMHQRNVSMDSVSTTATFATATESGGSSLNGQSVEDDEIDYALRNPSSMRLPGSFPRNPSSRSNSNLGMRSSSASRPAPTPHRTIGQSRTITRDDAQPSQGHQLNGLGPATSSTSHLPGSKSLSPNRHPLDEIAEISAADLVSPRPLSLLLSALKGFEPSSSGQSTTATGLRDEDRAMVKRLLESLGRACAQLQIASVQARGREEHIWRLRLDEARRILDGE